MTPGLIPEITRQTETIATQIVTALMNGQAVKKNDIAALVVSTNPIGIFSDIDLASTRALRFFVFEFPLLV